MLSFIRSFIQALCDIIRNPWMIQELKTTFVTLFTGKVGEAYVKIPDANGDEILMGDLNGELVPAFPGFGTRIPEAQNLVPRDDDIWIVNYPKSGTHWIYEIVSMLISGEAKLTNSLKESTMFPELRSLKAVEGLPSPRIINSHIQLKLFPQASLRKGKIIYSTRNPKDVAVSYYYHMRGLSNYDYKGSWSGFYKPFIEGKVEYGSWFDHIESWLAALEGNPNALLIRFEDMKKNMKKEVRRIAEFIGIPCEDLYDDIVYQCTFENMKKNKKDTKWIWKSDGVGMYRKGIVGDWKNHFTVAQNEEMNKILQERMKTINLKVTYT